MNHKKSYITTLHQSDCIDLDSYWSGFSHHNNLIVCASLEGQLSLKFISFLSFTFYLSTLTLTICLTHFMPLISLYTPWKYQTTRGMKWVKRHFVLLMIKIQLLKMLEGVISSRSVKAPHLFQCPLKTPENLWFSKTQGFLVFTGGY